MCSRGWPLSCLVLRRFRRLQALRHAVLSALLISALFFTPVFVAPAQAEAVRVSASADAGAAPVLARQQAQERAFSEAVFLTARRLLPAPLTDDRAGLLRRYLTPRAVDFVQSFQEAAPAKAPAAAAVGAEAAPATASAATSAAAPAVGAPLTLDLDVEVNRASLSDLLTRLGLLAGARHPRTFVLRLGSGVAEPDLQPLEELLALQGLKRMLQTQGQTQGPAAGLVQVSLERVPQGYLKAVLRQDVKAFAADGRDLSQLWLDVWGQYFSAREQQPGSAASPIEIAGFALVDGVLDFTRTLSSWDDCLREVQLSVVDIRPGNSSARWSGRVTNQARLNEHLQEYLPGRQLRALRQSPGAQP